jgi:hypothetical protein
VGDALVAEVGADLDGVGRDLGAEDAVDVGHGSPPGALG